MKIITTKDVEKYLDSFAKGETFIIKRYVEVDDLKKYVYSRIKINEDFKNNIPCARKESLDTANSELKYLLDELSQSREDVSLGNGGKGSALRPTVLSPSSLVTFKSNSWKCNRCGKWTKVKSQMTMGEHLKRCKCGRQMVILVKYFPEEYTHKIVGLRDSCRRCSRGTPKKVGDIL